MTFRIQNFTQMKIHIDPIEPSIVPTSQNYVSYTQSETVRSRKKNMLLSEFESDIGYPQQILLQDRPKTDRQSKNYLRLNIKKMREYGPAFVDLGKLNFLKPTENLNPKNILEVKKKEIKKKQQTKINLRKDALISRIKKNTNQQMKRVDEMFLKKLQKGDQEFEGGMTTRKKQNTSGFKKYTESFMLKRSLTRKKMAYYQVFGEEAEVKRQSLTIKDFTKTQSNLKKKTLQQARIAMETELQRKKFTQIVNKLEFYDQIFAGNIEIQNLNNEINQKIQTQIKNKHQIEKKQKNLLDNVRRLSKNDQQQRFNKNYQPLSTIKDLTKIDPEFSQQLKNHKDRKIKLMKKDLVETDDLMIFRSQDHAQQYQLNQSEQKSLSNTNSNEEFIMNKNELFFISRPTTKSPRIKDMTLDRFDKLRFFLRNLFQVRDEALRFGIPMKFLYFAMFQQKKSEYVLEGSYIFYKAIIANDIDTVKSFIDQTPKMLYEIDEQGRTPLILASQLNFYQIAEFFIDQGVNLDAYSYKGKNSLYYAVKNNDRKLVKKLLVGGASPWSIHNFGLNKIIKDQKIRQLIKNARKISIALKISKIGRRLQLWNELKNKIIQGFEDSFIH